MSASLRVGGQRKEDSQPQRSGLALNGQWWPWGGWRTCGVLAGTQVRAERRPGFVLQASGRRSPESCSKPEKILKRGTYDKVGGSGGVGGTLRLQNCTGSPDAPRCWPQQHQASFYPRFPSEMGRIVGGFPQGWVVGRAEATC